MKAEPEYTVSGTKKKASNFTGTKDIIFTISKAKIHPVADENTVIKKVYDGTTDVSEQILANSSPLYDAKSKAGKTRSKILEFNRENGGVAVYSSKNVGMNNVNLSGIKISSTEQSAIDHYELITDKLTLSGEITKATLNSNSEVKAKAPLLYTGTSQRPEVVYDIKGIAGDSGKGIPAERSTNAENDGTTANPIDGLEILYKVHDAEDSTYSPEVPSFTDIGNYQVDYKVTSTNYEDLTGTFDVQIQKMNLVDAYVGFKKSSLVYTGSALDPGMTVKGSETSEDIVSGENYTVKYQRVQDVSGNTVTEETVTAPTEAGTYNVIITAKQESTFVEGAKTVEKGVTVLPKALSDTQGKPTVSMTPESFTYDTKVHQVKDGNIVVTDTDRNVTLTQGTDYEITPPSDPIQTAKTYIFTFTGKGNYTGSCTKEIEVKKADLTNATVEINGTYTYSGEAQEPGKEDIQVKLDKQVTYKEDAPEFTAVYDGFVGEETLAGVGGTISFLCEYKNGSPVGDYEIQPEVTGLANYEVTANKGTLSVQPRTPVLTDSANLYTTRIYDGKAVDLAPTTDGDGEMSSVITNRETNEVLTSDPVDVGKYHVVYSFDAGKNYSAGSVAYDFDITPAPLKITAADQKLLYLDEIPEYTADYDGFVNGENLESAGGTVRFDCSYQKGTAVGSYSINPEVTGLKNYEVTTESGTMTVEKRTPVFTDSANLYTTRVYDGKAVDLTPVTDGTER